ncbi:hypothetical protein HMPREF9413_5220 [Paenibacillus sp. HGF7]|nr:hypothetical protein HMPREF9413_5220 [Paenibacillus sp. HGF7]
MILSGRIRKPRLWSKVGVNVDIRFLRKSSISAARFPDRDGENEIVKE